MLHGWMRRSGVPCVPYPYDKQLILGLGFCASHMHPGPRRRAGLHSSRLGKEDVHRLVRPVGGAAVDGRPKFAHLGLTEAGDQARAGRKRAGLRPAEKEVMALWVKCVDVLIIISGLNPHRILWLIQV